MTKTTIAVPAELLRALIDGADEAADLRQRDADRAEDGKDQERTDRKMANKYREAVRTALELERRA